MTALQAGIWIFVVVAMAALHRLRGGGYMKLPVKGTYVLWPVVGMLAWLAGAPALAAAVWAAGYFIWIIRAWIIEVTALTGAAIPAGQITGGGWDVDAIWWLSRGNPLAATLLRAILFLIPTAVALGWLYGPLAAAALLPIVPVFPAAYLLGYRLRPLDMASVAEPIVGASWGVSIVLFSLVLIHS